MTMYSTVNEGTRVEFHGVGAKMTRDDEVLIEQWTSTGVVKGSTYVKVEEFIADVMALGIPGLTYEKPLELPTEPGLYIKEDQVGDGSLANGPFTYRLNRSGQWQRHGHGETFTEDYMRQRLPLVRLVVES